LHRRVHVHQDGKLAEGYVALLQHSLDVLNTTNAIEEAAHSAEMDRVRRAIERAHARELAELHVDTRRAHLRKARRQFDDD
jgi:hypothetical protein